MSGERRGIEDSSTGDIAEITSLTQKIIRDNSKIVIREIQKSEASSGSPNPETQRGDKPLISSSDSEPSQPAQHAGHLSEDLPAVEIKEIAKKPDPLSFLRDIHISKRDIHKKLTFPTQHTYGRFTYRRARRPSSSLAASLVVILMLFLFSLLVLQQGRLDTPAGGVTFRVPALSEKNFIVNATLNGTQTRIISPSTIRLDEPVPWEIEVTRNGQVNRVQYTTPAVRKTSELVYTGEGWIDTIFLHTDYKGTYENLSFYETLPSTLITEMTPQLEYSLTPDSQVILTIPKFEKDMAILLVGTLANLTNTTNLSTILPASSMEIGTEIGRLALTSTAGNITQLSLDEEMSLSFRITGLSPGQEIKATLELPFEIPQDMHVYFWKESTKGSGAGNMAEDDTLYGADDGEGNEDAEESSEGTNEPTQIEVPYDVGDTRTTITLTLRDGVIDDDGTINGEIIDPLKLYIPKTRPKISRISEKDAIISLSQSEGSPELRIISDTGAFETLEVVEPSNLPRLPVGESQFPYKLLKFTLVNLTDGKATIYLDSSTMPGGVNLWKFNPNTGEWYTMPYERISLETIAVTFFDGGLGDDDGIVNGEIQDDLGITNKWWGDSWIWRQAINISNVAGDLSQFQVQLSLTGSVFNFSKANANLSDLRFTMYNASSDTEIKIPYYLKTGEINYSGGLTTAVVWVKVPFLTNNINTTVFVYYGNAAALSESNGTAVFEFFDDFSSGLSKWNYTPDSIAIVNGVLQIANGTTSGNYGFRLISSNKTYTSFANGTIEGRIYLDYAAVGAIAEVAFRGTPSTNSGYKSRLDARTNEGLSHLNNPYSGWGVISGPTGTNSPQNTWFDFAITANGTTLTVTGGGATQVYTSASYGTPGEIALMNHYGNYALFDNISVRKFASVDPTVYYGGAEYGGILNISITLPADQSHKIRLQPFEMSGLLNCTRASCGIVSAYSQFYTTSSPLQSWTETTTSDFSDPQNSSNVTISDGSIQLESDVVGPAWWNSNWAYRKAYNLTNLAGNLSAYQLQFNINSSLVGPDFNWITDENRLRFVFYNITSGGNTLLPYWIEAWNTTGPNATIWVKVPYLINNTNTSVYMYYGNPSAANGSNASQTFDFYNDGNSLSGWTVAGATINSVTGNPVNSITAAGGQYAYIDAGLTSNRILELDGWVISGGSYQLSNIYFMVNSAGQGQMLRLEGRGSTSSGFASTTSWISWNAPSGYTPVSQATWHKVRIELRNTTAYGFIDGASYGTYAVSNNGGIIAVHGDSGVVQGGYFDNIRIRKYAASTPSIYPLAQENISLKPYGKYESSIFDIGYSDVVFQNISWNALANENISLQVYSKSSIDNISWSPWYLESNNAEIQSPSRRYIQYRLILNTTSTRATPILYDIILGYYVTSNTWQNMAGSGTIFTASNPYSCGTLDQTSQNCTSTWSVYPSQAGNYSVRICAVSTITDIPTLCSGARNISVWIQPSLSEFTSSTNPVGKGQNTTLQVRLFDDTGTAIANSNVSFVDMTGNGTTAYYIGQATTDNQGYANIVYMIPSNSSLSIHVINASYSGSSTTYLLPVSTTKSTTLSSTPLVLNITTTPSSVGFGYTILITANVTDEKGLDRILINITENGISSIYPMNLKSTNIYNYTFNDTWAAKTISFNIIANNTDGIRYVSQNNYFSVAVDANLTFATEYDNYRNFEVVRIKNSVPGWSYGGWKYRRPITVTPAANISNYSLQIDFNPLNFVFNDALANGSDIRFTYIDPTTSSEVQLPFWIDRWNSTTQQGTAWVRVPMVTAPTTTLYIYYGNSGTSSASNGTATFDFYDDFSGASLDTSKWDDVNVAQGTLSFASGKISITSAGDWWGTADTSRYIVSKAIFNYDYIAESLVTTFAADGWNRFFGLRNSNRTNSSVFVMLGDSNWDHITNVWRDTEQGTADWYGEDTGVAIADTNNKLAKFVRIGDQVTSYINSTQTNQRSVSGWNLTHVALTKTQGAVNPNQFDWIRVRKYVSSEPSVSVGSSQNGIPGIQNNGDTTFQGYLRMLVQSWSGSAWQNIIPPVMDSTLYIVANKTVLNLSQIWDAYGAWNTTNRNPGWYRVYVVMEDASHNVLNDSNGKSIESWYNFTILEATLTLTNLTYDNYYRYNLSEYETGDRIYWVNVSIRSQNNTAFNANLSLNILDQSYVPVGWGPNETKQCGNISQNGICQQKFDNSTNGYMIPVGAATGNYNFFWEVNMGIQNGDLQQNNSLFFTLHNIPSTLSKAVTSTRLYKPSSSDYNVTLTNLWSRNITNVSITINCPEIDGFICSCRYGGGRTCIVGKLANSTTAVVSFNVSANTSVASNDYVVNITLNYTNPAGQNKSWVDYMPHTFEVRLLGILEVTPIIYPTNLTRGYASDFKVRINNTGDTQAGDIWVNYTLPPGWSNTSGSLRLYRATLDPSTLMWNNITAYVGIGSALGPSQVRIDASASDGRNDWKVLDVFVYANTTIGLSTNGSFDVSQDVNWANRDDLVKVSATLRYDNGSAIPGKNITFYDSTSNTYLGSALTNATGIASINYSIPSGATLGYHTLNASFAGDSAIYAWASFNISSLDIRMRAQIAGATTNPSVIGYGNNVTIQATVTDDIQVDIVRINLTYPNGTAFLFQMNSIPPSTYTFTTGDNWQYGQYNFTIIANDTDGSITYSQMLNFTVSVSAGMMLKTQNDNYSSNQYVNLTSAKASWWNAGWPYRRPVTFNYTGGNLSGYQINVSINLSSAYLSGNVMQDCRDVRFSYYNSSTSSESGIPFWIESCNLSTSNTAVFWIRVPFISTGAIVYAYYGNSGAGLASNASSTFDFFDDFLGSSLDASLWDDVLAGGGSLTVSSGLLAMSSAGDWWSTADTARYVVSKQAFDYNYTAEALLTSFGADGYVRMFGLRNSNKTTSSMFVLLGDSNWDHITNVWRDTEAGNADWYLEDSGVAISDRNNKLLTFVRIGNNVTSYVNGTRANSRVTANWNLTHVALTKTGGAVNTNQFDWIRVRKYSSFVPNSTIGDEEQPGSLIINSGATNFSGYLVMKVQKNVSGNWQDVATVINDVETGTRRNIGSSTLNLTGIWNSVSWYTNSQNSGTYRVYGELVSPSGILLYGGADYLNASDNFLINVSQPELLLNISNIMIYDVTTTAAGNRHFYTNDFVDSGLNKTFNLYIDHLYRIEITVSNLGSSNWSINTTNVSDSGLNPSWGVYPSADVWYSNKTVEDDKRSDSSFTGGVWSSNLTWNTTQNRGSVINGRNATFFFLLNITQLGDVQNIFRVVHDTFTKADYSSFHIIQLDTQPPKIFNNIYNLTNNSIERGGSTVAYARWSETIAQANVSYTTTTNTTWAYATNTSPQNPQNWTNFTLQSTSIWFLGIHNVQISAKDESNNWNTTLPYLNLTVWGRAQVTGGALNSSTITMNQTVRIACLVTDYTTTSTPVSGYIVSFYNSTGLLGKSSTNSTGWATYDYTDRTSGFETLVCNITENLTAYYRTDSSNYQSFSLTTGETTSPYYTNITGPTLLHRGDTVVLSVYWHDNFELGYAILGTNSSGSWSNVSIINLNTTDSYSNFTYQFPTTTPLGAAGWRQYANDTFGNTNMTPIQTVDIWGWSKIAFASLSPAGIQAGNTTSMRCQVTDANTSAALTNYNVTFWMKNSTSAYQYMGSNLTDAGGWANFSSIFSVIDTYTILCNITNNASMRYNATYPSSGVDTLNVVSGSDVSPPYILGTTYQLNATELYMGSCVKLSAQWNEELNLSWMNYDPLTIGSYITSNLSPPYTQNWTNTTICTNSSWAAGNHSVKLYARDKSGNTNNTAPFKYFVVWGRAQLTFLSPSGNLNREVISLFCNVSDYDTRLGINNYSVTFYDGDLGYSIGTNATNSSGIAKITYNFSGHNVGPDQLSCTISDNNARYYKVYGSTSATNTIYLYGTLYANITNPLNSTQAYRGYSLSLNSTVYDEFGNIPKDENNNIAAITALWYNDSNQQVASGKNTTWSIPSTYGLGPENLTINVSATYYWSSSAKANFTIYSYSYVTWVSPSTGYYRNLTLNLTCLVRDNTTGQALSTYPVEFFDNSSTLGFSATNSSGHALRQLSTDSLVEGNHSLRCMIYDNSTLYYTRTPTTSQANITIIVDLTKPAIYFNPNTDSSGSYMRNWIFINITAQDSYIDRVRLYWNGTAQNFTNISGSLYWINKTGLSDGIYTFYAYANDSAGNFNITENRTVRIDTTPPSITVISPINNSYHLTQTPYFNVSLNENASSCWFSLDEGANTTMQALNLTYFYNITSLAQGLHNVTFYCNDTVGNLQTKGYYFLTLDTIPPQITLKAPSNYFNSSSTSVVFNCSVSDNVALRNVSLYGNWSGWSAKSTNISGVNGTDYIFNLTLPEGTFVWNCRGCDNTNCSTASSNWTITVDTQSPSLSVLSPVNNRAYNSTSVMLNYTVSDLHLSQCWYNNGTSNTPLGGCANATLTGLSEGNHSITVYANDSAGNIVAANRNFSVDTKNPSLTLQSPIDGTKYESINDIDLNYSVSDNLVLDKCWYKLDGAANVYLSGCINTTLLGLSNANHSLVLYVNDTAGNRNSTNITFLVNITNLVTNVEVPLNNSYHNTSTLYLNATTNRPALMCNYSLDGGALVGMGNDTNLHWYALSPSLSEGLHNVSFNCTDGVEMKRSSYSFFRIDLTPPILTIYSPEQDRRYNSTSVNLNYTAYDSNPKNCTYSLDGGSSTALANCVNITLTSLSQGRHNVSVTVRDAALNTNSSIVWFFVDTIPPSLTIISPANTTYTATSLQYNVSLSENGSTCSYSLDLAAPGTLTPLNLTYYYTSSTVSDGNHNLVFYCNDTTGNTGTANVSFVVDTTGPVVTFVPPTPSDGQAIDYNSTYVNITLNEAGSLALLEWDYNNGTVVNYTMSSSGTMNWRYNVTMLADGYYYYRVFVNDTFGNLRITATRSVQIATTGPAVTIVSPTATNYSHNYLPLDVTANKEISVWKYSINGRANLTFTPNTSIAAQMGQNNLTVYATDMTGLSGSSSVSFNVSGYSWYDSYDHYSGINSSSNLTALNSTARIEFCWSFNMAEGCWPYRKNLSISGSTGALYSYQLKLNLNLTSEFVSGKLNSSCSDLRFTWINTTSGSEAEIPYYIENCNLTGGNVSLFVKVPQIATTGTSVLMYYGNLAASNRSNGTTTFEFFDDFTSVISSQWGANAANWLSADGIAYPTVNLGSSTLTSSYSTPTSYATELRWAGNSTGGVAGYYRLGSTTSKLTLYIDSLNGRISLNNGSDNYAYLNTSRQQSYTLVSDFTGNSYKLYINRNSSPAISLTTPDTGSITKPVFYSYAASGILLDWLGIRKYSTPEPAITSVGSEAMPVKNASLSTITIVPTDFGSWLTLKANVSSLPSGTNVSFSVIDASTGAVQLICNYTQAQLGCNMTSVSADSVYIRAQLTTGTTLISPAIDWLNISWTNDVQNYDITVQSITFSTYSAVEGTPVSANVNISNTGLTAAGAFAVELNISFLNTSWQHKQSLTLNLTTLGAQSSAIISFNWTASPGTYNFSVFADSNGSLAESSETNNRLSANYTVAGWQTMYGLYNYSFLLTGTEVYQEWDGANLSGYIYYSDIDSSYNPPDLLPLNGTNNLSVADIAMGMNSFNDSLSRLYDRDGNGLPDAYAEIIISGTPFMMPVINSTNTSTFITGIMYDSADGAAYNGANDLVFVTILNQNQIGKYGTYDYEVRLPSRLGRLKGVTNLVTRLDDVS